MTEPGSVKHFRRLSMKWNSGFRVLELDPGLKTTLRTHTCKYTPFGPVLKITGTSEWFLRLKMTPVDRSCANATLQPNIYIEKLDISWLRLCITDVAASGKYLITTCSEGCPPKRGDSHLWKWRQVTDPPQTQLSSISSTLKSPVFPGLACGLGWAAEQIQGNI